MNNLLSASWRREGVVGVVGVVEMAGNPISGGASLEKFLEEAEAIKEELREMERLRRSLHDANEGSKTLHDAAAVRALRSRMDADVAEALRKARAVKLQIEFLDRANAANREVPGCGPGTSTDRTRVSVAAGLRTKLKEQMERFQELRMKITAEYKETIERRYYTVTGEKPDENTVEALISTGEGEKFFQRAIQQQGRATVVDMIQEIQERRGATMELEKGLLELQQVFMDMAVLVAAQGEQLDDIESQIGKARSYVQRGTEQLVTAKKHQKNTRKWTLFAIVLLLIIVMIIVLPIVLNK